MKAMSVVLPQAQRPFTILGVPGPLAMLALSAGAFGGSLMVVMRLAPLFLPVGVAITVALWSYFWRRCRLDPHFDRVLLRTPRFWRGKPERTLIAGAP